MKPLSLNAKRYCRALMTGLLKGPLRHTVNRSIKKYGYYNACTYWSRYYRVGKNNRIYRRGG